jgi:hypothetical protein
MPETGGAATHHAYGVVGEDTDLGAVEVLESTKVYVDIELRTTESEDAVERAKVGHYVCYHSVNKEFSAGDYLEFDGEQYRVEVETHDSGFGFSRLVKEEPCYRTGTYHYGAGETVAYDPATGVATTTGAVDAEFSYIPGMMVDSFDSSNQEYDNEDSIYVYKRHLGFEPKVGDSLVVDGEARRVKKVTYSALQLQWKLGIGT